MGIPTFAQFPHACAARVVVQRHAQTHLDKLTEYKIDLMEHV